MNKYQQELSPHMKTIEKQLGPIVAILAVIVFSQINATMTEAVIRLSIPITLIILKEMYDIKFSDIKSRLSVK